MKTVKAVRCAIYTRKSTEEGLEQEFNSLHAQREACEAYVKSQRSEGWTVVPTGYDDGGYSGGNIERPALTALLTDIDRGHIDTVVVYKIDRLTRSLMDFAKIVERFERKGASFVSVTQAFNTTTSMGRLTLNVLLSFAQFEREVTGERIRDKLAASKRKGMWMGGSPPTGYDPVDRKLIVNPAEAEFVRSIFQRFLKMRSIRAVARALNADGIVSKRWVSRRGRNRGGFAFSNGALHGILRNRLYVGEIRHKDAIFPGLHEAIVDRALFDKVQALLDRNLRNQKERPSTRLLFPLKGMIFDDKGNRMSPLRANLENGSVRRYYVSQALLKDRRDDAGSIPRVPASGIEDLVADRLGRVVKSHVQALDQTLSSDISIKEPTISADVVQLIERIEIGSHSVELFLKRDALKAALASRHSGARSKRPDEIISELRGRLPGGDMVDEGDGRVRVSIPVRLKFHGGERVLIESGAGTERLKPRIDPHLIKGLLRAHRWRDVLESGEATTTEEIALREGITRAYVRAILPLAFLAPDLTQRFLDGAQPAALTIDRMVRLDLPTSWMAQRRLFSQLSS